MKIKIVNTAEAYNDACERIYTLIHSTENPIDPDSPDGEEIALLSLLVEKYEREHFPVVAPDPIAAIKFRMDQMNLKQVDIAPLLGGKTRVSEILNGKRALTLKMIVLLNRYLGIPFESLLGANKDIDLEPEIEAKVLENSSIKNYFSGSMV